MRRSSALPNLGTGAINEWQLTRLLERLGPRHRGLQARDVREPGVCAPGTHHTTIISSSGQGASSRLDRLRPR